MAVVRVQWLVHWPMQLPALWQVVGLLMAVGMVASCAWVWQQCHALLCWMLVVVAELVVAVGAVAQLVTSVELAPQFSCAWWTAHVCPCTPENEPSPPCASGIGESML
jgi:hypothetical protein